MPSAQRRSDQEGERKRENLRSLNQELLRRIMALRALGYQQQEIADHLDVSKQTVWRYLKTVKEVAEERTKEDEETPDVVFFELFSEMIANKLIQNILESEGSSGFGFESEAETANAE